MEVKLINNNLVLDVIVDNSSDVNDDEYAFYLMHYKEKIAEQWYSKSKHIQFPLPDKKGEYYVICFQRNLKKNTKSKSNSNRLLISPAIRLNIPVGSSKGHYKQLKFFRRVIHGDYVSLKKNGYIPRVGATPIPLRIPVNYGPRNDRNIEFALNSWKFLAPIWKHYFETKKLRFLKEIYAFMLDWSKSLSIKSGENTFAWYDMAVGTRAIHLGLFLYVLNEESIEFSPRDTRILNDIVEDHIVYLENEKNLKFNNHGVWQILGLRLLYWSKNELDKSKIEFCEQQLDKLIQLNFTDENVSSENSPFYHKYTADLICQIPTQLFKNTQARITAIQEQKDEISGWLTSPSGFFFLIGDSDDKGMELKTESRCDFIENDKCFVSRHYPDSGYAIVRTHPDTKIQDSSALIFHATSSSYSHAHADKLSFILFQKGIELITDSGKYSYENDQWRRYFVSDRAHNTVGFSQKVIMPNEIELGDSSISACTVSGGEYILSGATQVRSLGFKHSREITYRPDRYIHIVDTINHSAGKSDGLEARLHFGLDISLQEINNRIVALHENKIIASIEMDAKLQKYKVYCGSEKPILGWTSRVYRKKKPVNTLIMTFGGDTKEITTKIYLEASSFFSEK